MEHYYSQNPQAEHDIKQIRYTFKGLELLFYTDAGVFSKDRVDAGSDLLIRTLLQHGLTGEVLDMGCGYGPIGIAIAKAYPKVHVTMVDINARAVELARKNIELNKISNANVLHSDGFSEISGAFDAIVSNPPIRAGKDIIYPIFERSIDYLKNGASFYIVIQKKQGAPSAINKLAGIYGNCEKIAKSGGYWVLRSEKEG